MIFFLTKKCQKVPEKSEKVPKNNLKRPKSAEKCQKAGFQSFGATIRTRRESQCLPYEGFSPNRPLGRFGLVVAMSIYVQGVQKECNLFLLVQLPITRKMFVEYD